MFRRRKISKLIIIRNCLYLATAAIVAVMTWICIPGNTDGTKTMTVEHRNWCHDTLISKLVEVQKSGFEVPTGGRLIYSKVGDYISVYDEEKGRMVDTFEHEPTTYYYYIYEWQYCRSCTSRGTDNQPYIAEVELEYNEKVVGVDKWYSISGHDKDGQYHTFYVSCEEWNNIMVGKTIRYIPKPLSHIEIVDFDA